MIVTCLLYAMEKHEGQIRKGGEPYITHPMEVAKILENKGYTNPNFIITGLFHDLLEDTDATSAEILNLGGYEVLQAVVLLTKSSLVDMDNYVWRISQNAITRAVKLADRLHNLRSAVVADVEFRKRYIAETEKYYVPLAKYTVFEQDIADALKVLEETLFDEKEYKPL